MSDPSISKKAVRISISLVLAVASYAAVAVVLDSWFWLGIEAAVVAVVVAAADRLIRAAWRTAPRREPIRLPPIHPTDRRRDA
jgi:hypothetical protein